MATEPKIYRKNYINGDCTISVSSNPSFKSRLYDFDIDATWDSSGQNDDTNLCSIVVEFPVATRLDHFILLNHNLKNPLVYAWDGADWVLIALATNVAASTTVMVSDSTTTTKIMLLDYDTQTVNAEKSIGDFIATELWVDPGVDLSSYDVTYEEKGFSIMLADGSLHRSVIHSTPTRTSKYTARVRFDYLSKTTLDLFGAIKEAGGVLVWQPESITQPEIIYQVNWTNGLRYRYISTYKGAGFQLDMDLREV